MEPVSKESVQSVSDVESYLVRNYSRKVILFDDILKRTGLSASFLNGLLRKLEKRGTIHVERFPRLDGNVLRNDYRTKDRIYIHRFPTIRRKSLLYKTRVEYGDYTINHVFGCSHGCNYPCYAMQMSKRWGRISDMDDWMHPKIVENALDLLDVEIPKMNGNIQFVHLSFMSDPFMYDAVNERNYPQIQDLTLKIISKLNHCRIKATVLTKGLLPKELESKSLDKRNEYGITLVSLDDEFQKQYEPFSAPQWERIAELEKRHDAGLRTWVSFEPYPTPNIVKQDINELLAEVSFVDKMIFGRWNYNPEIAKYPKFIEFYRGCAAEVIHFCELNGIEYHIKNGTPGSQSETEHLFSK